MTTARSTAALLLASLAAAPACQDTGGSGIGWELIHGLSTLGAEPAPAGPTVAWHHDLGAELDVPADWEIVPDDGSSAFVPPGERIDGENARLVCSFVFVEAPGARSLDSLESVQDAAVDTAVLAQFLEHAQDVEFVALRDRAAVVLGFDSHNEGVDGRIELYATVHGEQIVGLLVAGERASFDAHRPAISTMFHSLRFGPGGAAIAQASVGSSGAAGAAGQPLVGRWTHSEGYASGGFSIATETTMVLGNDGRYRWSSEVAGGDSYNGFDSGDSPETGRWSADGRVLRLIADDGSEREYGFRLVDGTLVLEDASGNVRYFE
jgi:hypothetical protein